MEMTLGKRISAARKKLGLTQDQLAEQLGVTAQAVSKWENDQSCPDITMLPRLAEIFGMSTDALLGMEKEPVHQAQVVEPEEARPRGLTFENGSMEFHYDSGHRGSIGFGLWVLLTGILTFAAIVLPKVLPLHPIRDASLWNIAWPTGLLVFGLFGLYPRLSFLRLGCAIFGGCVLAGCFLPMRLHDELVLPAILALFGLSLLVDALRKPRKARGRSQDLQKQTASYSFDNDRFDCDLSFGQARQRVDSVCLKGGDAEVSFGELTVDLSGCEAFAPGCHIDLDCSFGQLTLLVPRTYRIRETRDTSFGSVEFKGSPSPDASAEITADCDVSFGQILIQYI